MGFSFDASLTIAAGRHRVRVLFLRSVSPVRKQQSRAIGDSPVPRSKSFSIVNGICPLNRSVAALNPRESLRERAQRAHAYRFPWIATNKRT